MRHRNHYFDGPDRAVRFAHSMHRRDHPTPPRFFGFLLLTFGVLFLLDSLNIIEARSFIRTYWPVGFVAWGTMRMIVGGGAGRFAGALLAGVGGVFLANSVFAWDVRFWRLIWPVLMMVFGLHILLHPGRRFGRRRAPRVPPMPPMGMAAEPAIDGEPVEDADADLEDDPEVETSGMFKASAVTATVHRKIVSQAFHSGLAVAMAGGLELDLRDCRMATGEARIVVRVMMGEVVLRIPRDWTVENHIAATLANVENHTDAPIDNSSKRLVLEGSAIIGNVEIRN
jgi:predicted membrane protein